MEHLSDDFQQEIHRHVLAKMVHNNGDHQAGLAHVSALIICQHDDSSRARAMSASATLSSRCTTIPSLGKGAPLSQQLLWLARVFQQTLISNTLNASI